MRKPDVNIEVVRQIARRALPGTDSFSVTRAGEGVSTQVYRLAGNGATYYLRVAEEEAAAIEPEALAHRLLRRRGVRVPDVVYVEAFNDDLGRAVMITSEIPGCSLAACQSSVDVREIVFEAGRDLAAINSLEVDGFGWITRDRPASPRLEAALPNQREFALQDIDQHLARISECFFGQADVGAIERTLGRYDGWLDGVDARLAHGDLDVTHIYHQHGRYTGIIDLGEIRGASRFYDLGHFAVHDGEDVPTPLLPYLLDGYRTHSALPADYAQRIHLEGLLISTRALARSASKPRGTYQDHLAEAIRRCLRVLAA